MHGGSRIIGTAAVLSIAACGGEQGKLEIRPIGAPRVAEGAAVPLRIAEARGQFALGNVALALEGFRRALREDPESVDALTGIAACYDSMARFDLSRRHYEAALAIAPGDPRLLAAFASSLDRQGRRAEAARVRTEIGQRLAALQPPVPIPVAPALAPSPAPVVTTAPPAPAAPAVTAAAAPAPTPAKSAGAPPRSVVATLVPVQPVQRAVPKPLDRQTRTAIASAEPPARTAGPTPTRVAVLAAPVAAPLPPAPVAAPASTPRAATPAIGRSVTVALPPARPAAPTPPAPAATVATPMATLASAPPPAAPPVKRLAENATEPRAAVLDDAAKAKPGPRLERTSPSEVTLVTGPAPIWRALAVNRSPRTATIRYVPIRQTATRFSGVRLLNAARVDRLAARTRQYLAGRGWGSMTIGNATRVRARSLILYPAERRRLAERLSRQFGFAIAQRSDAAHVTVLLGRDAARVSALRAKG